MARRVFFSFHYERDVWRAGQIRNSWLTKPDRASAGFWDAAKWESVKKKGDAAIKQWIRAQMKGTSVTVVLIGAQTVTRPYVLYEIEHSWTIKNGIIGIYIDSLKDSKGYTDTRGQDPFKKLGWKNFKTYDWVRERGYTNLGKWVEAAHLRARTRKHT